MLFVGYDFENLRPGSRADIQPQESQDFLFYSHSQHLESPNKDIPSQHSRSLGIDVNSLPLIFLWWKSPGWNTFCLVSLMNKQHYDSVQF